IATRRFVPDAGLVAARQSVALRCPAELERQQPTLRVRNAERKALVSCVAVVDVVRTDLIGAELDVGVRGCPDLEPRRPLAGRPVHPVVTDDIPGLRAAEREVLEVARESVEVRADRQPADAPVEQAVEELLIEREDREVPGLSAPI